MSKSTICKGNLICLHSRVQPCHYPLPSKYGPFYSIAYIFALVDLSDALTQTVVLSRNYPVRRAAEYAVLYQHGRFPRHGRRTVVVLAERDSVQRQVVPVSGNHRVPFHRVSFLSDVIVLCTETRYVDRMSYWRA